MKPAAIIIFGITGDLSKRKLLPALYHLIKDDLLPEQTRIIGLSRRQINVDDLLKDVELCILDADNVCDPNVIAKFKDHLDMLQMDPERPGDYSRLSDDLNRLENEHQTCLNRLFYLAIPPSVYGTVVRHLGESGFAGTCQHGTAASRLLVEKPFGYDLESAEELVSGTAKYFKEEQIFRIDHYLAKGTAQNILTFRRNNPLFASIWDGKHINKVEIVASEAIGVQGRAGFYDDIGALRDLVQSHLLQLLALTAMELPTDFDDRSIHAAKQELLSDVEAIPTSMLASRVQRGQYEGYREDVSNPHSHTETFASVDLQILNGRWEQTIFSLVTGKKLAVKQTFIRLYFAGQDEIANVLTFRLQPNEGIDITLQVKQPGFEAESVPAVLNFDYKAAAHPDAYERVLVDAVRGDRTLFASSDEVLASWRVIQPILNAWQMNSDDLIYYPPGTEWSAVKLS